MRAEDGTLSLDEALERRHKEVVQRRHKDRVDSIVAAVSSSDTAAELQEKSMAIATPEKTRGAAYDDAHTKSDGKKKDRSIWSVVGRVGPHARRVLLYGPPGTGKSYVARTAGVKPGRTVHPIIIHSDLPAAELRGHFMPTQMKDAAGNPLPSAEFLWHDGPAVRAWRDGGRLVLDELDKLGDDGLSFILGILDDEETALLELGTTGEVISPHKDFTIWATMNGLPEDLPPALQDRFPTTFHIDAPHPAAIARLPEDLRYAAQKMSIEKSAAKHVGLRSFIEYARLRDQCPGIDAEDAGIAVFGDRWSALRTALLLSSHGDVR